MFSLNVLGIFEQNIEFYLHVKFYLAIFDLLFQSARILTMDSSMQNTGCQSQLCVFDNRNFYIYCIH